MFKLREHISIGITAALVFGMLWQTFIVIDFYVNREEITAEHCINIATPELNCKGQCHLKKQLEAATPDQNEDTKTSGSSKTSLLILVYAETGNDTADLKPIDVEGEFADELYIKNDYVSEILHPPQFV